MMRSPLDSNTAALRARAGLNASRSIRDLEAWILEHVGPLGEIDVAELGCGTGKQLFALAEAASPTATLLGLDISSEAVTAVNEQARRSGRANVTAIEGALDDCPAALGPGRFDLILSAYAIYYASDMTAVLLALRNALRPGGQLFVSGPGSGTNREILALVGDVAGEPAGRVDDFASGDVIAALRAQYDSLTVQRLENRVRFKSAAEVENWWRNHSSFRPDVADEVLRLIAGTIAVEGHYDLTKNVLGLHGRA